MCMQVESVTVWLLAVSSASMLVPVLAPTKSPFVLNARAHTHTHINTHTHTHTPTVSHSFLAHSWFLRCVRKEGIMSNRTTERLRD